MAQEKAKLLPLETVPTLQYEYGLNVMSGVQKGKYFPLETKRIVVGRGNQCDLIILDNKASREHFELVLIDNDYIVTDLGSQNGIFINQLKSNSKKLVNKDQLVMGDTLFLFEKKVKVRTNPLAVVNNPLARGTQTQTSTDENVEQSGSKKLILIFFALLIGYLIVPTTDQNTPKKNQKSNTSMKTQEDLELINSINKQVKKENRELKSKLDVIFQRGLRELREKNYFRAMEEFELALVHAPNHIQADHYLKVAKRSLQNEIERNLINGIRDRDALRYTKAVVSFCNVMRLLQNYPDDKEYIKAENNLKELSTLMDIDQDEIKCLSK